MDLSAGFLAGFGWIAMDIFIIGLFEQNRVPGIDSSRAPVRSIGQ